MSMTTLLVVGGLVTLLLLAGLAVIGFANRRPDRQIGAPEQTPAAVRPDQPPLPGIEP